MRSSFDSVFCCRPSAGVSYLNGNFIVHVLTESKLRFGDASSNSLSSSKSVSKISVAADGGRVDDRSKKESTCFRLYTSVRALVERDDMLAVLSILTSTNRFRIK